MPGRKPIIKIQFNSRFFNHDLSIHQNNEDYSRYSELKELKEKINEKCQQIITII